MRPSDVSIGVTIVHAPWDARRRAWVAGIRREMPGAVVVPDNDRRGLWHTCKRGWMAAALARGATHALPLADDMLPVRGCMASLRNAVAVQPEAILVLHTARPTVVAAALESGTRWATGQNAVWGGAMLMPAPWVFDFLKWEAANIKPDYPHDDTRLKLWAMTHDRPVYVLVPSLVEHVGWDASIVGHGLLNRRTILLADDAAAIDWSVGADRPVRIKPQSQRAAIEGAYIHGAHPVAK